MKKILILSSLIFLGFLSNYVLAAEASVATSSHHHKMCKMDTDCHDNKVCVDGICKKACKTDADCHDKRVCSDGICKKACKIDTDCRRHHACVDGMCEKETKKKEM